MENKLSPKWTGPFSVDTNHNNSQRTKDTSRNSQSQAPPNLEKALVEEEPAINQNIRSFSFWSFHKRKFM